MGLVRAGASLAFGFTGATRALIHLHAAYTLGLWAVSAVAGRDRVAGPARNPAPRIAVLVAAHDEARVIEACVRSLQAQRYDADRFEIVVVADNCADDTAKLAAGAGATVLERRSGGPGGKPAAIAFGVAQIRDRGEPAAIAVIDADNVVDPGFLAAMAARFDAGEAVVQGQVDAKNPDASWVAASSAIGFWVIDGLAQRPRERLGLSAALMGTGFAARPELFAEVLAPAGALADDIEANARLALRGVRVAYEPSARTLDEKPTSIDTAKGQRQRWMKGRWAAVERWLPSLVVAAAFPSEGRSPGERARALDVAVQMLAPSLLFSAVLLGTLGSAEVAARALTGTGAMGRPGAGARRAVVLSLLYFLAPAATILRHSPGARVWAAYPLQPAFLLRSIPLAIRGFVARKDSSWAHTRHGVGERG